MCRQVIVLLVCAWTSPAAGFGQQQPIHNLSVMHDTRVEGPIVEAVALPLKCDANGSILTRLVENESMENFEQISADGRQAREFYVSKLEGIRKPRLIDFAPFATQILALVQDGIQFSYWIVKFAEDGGVVAKSKLPDGLRPSQIGVFPSGEILLAGREKSDTPAASTTPFVALFTNDGALLRRVTLKGDIVQDKDVANFRLPDSDYETVMAGSALVIGYDGIAYLMRRSTYGPIFQISASGHLIKTLKLEPMVDGVNSGLLVVSQDKIIVEYLQTRLNSTEIWRVALQVVDSRTGQNLLGVVHSDANIGPSLACFDRGDFVFLSAEDDLRYHLIRTSAAK